MKPNKPITAKDIASACGVSQATVSYIINNKEGKKISDATREKVLQTIKELKYIPNSCARSMRTQKAMSIGVVTGRDLINVSFNRVLRGVKYYGDTKGYSITLLNTEESEEDQIQEYRAYYQANKIDGILFVFYELSSELLEGLEEMGIPYLSINENGVATNDTCQSPFREVVNECISFCKQYNLRDIGFVKRTHCAKGYKHKIFKEQLEVHFPGANLKPIYANGRVEDAKKDIYNTLQEEKFDIVITPNQWLALITQSSILELKFQVPQHIKHICLGEGNVFQSMYPTITALDIPLEDMGGYAARTLIANFYNQQVEHEEFEYKVMYGMSTKI